MMKITSCAFQAIIVLVNVASYVAYWNVNVGTMVEQKYICTILALVKVSVAPSTETRVLVISVLQISADCLVIYYFVVTKYSSFKKCKVLHVYKIIVSIHLYLSPVSLPDS